MRPGALPTTGQSPHPSCLRGPNHPHLPVINRCGMAFGSRRREEHEGYGDATTQTEAWCLRIQQLLQHARTVLAAFAFFALRVLREVPRIVDLRVKSHAVVAHLKPERILVARQENLQPVGPRVPDGILHGLTGDPIHRLHHPQQRAADTWHDVLLQDPGGRQCKRIIPVGVLSGLHLAASSTASFWGGSNPSPFSLARRGIGRSARTWSSRLPTRHSARARRGQCPPRV